MSPNLWRGTGQRRAADRVPELVDGRNRLLFVACWQARELAVERKRTAKLTAANGILAARLEGVVIERNEAYDAYDELAARYSEITAVSVPAPADGQPAIPERDAETTREMTIPAVWGMDGLRRLVPKQAA